jgi:hypothetical protein
VTSREEFYLSCGQNDPFFRLLTRIFPQPLLTSPVDHEQNCQGNRNGSYAGVQQYGLPLTKADPAVATNECPAAHTNTEIPTWLHSEVTSQVLNGSLTISIMEGATFCSSQTSTPDMDFTSLQVFLPKLHL